MGAGPTPWPRSPPSLRSPGPPSTATSRRRDEEGPCQESGLRGRPISSVIRASVGRALARLSGAQSLS